VVTPPELKQAVEAELQWMEAIKAAGYDLAAQARPARPTRWERSPTIR
jgi:hypothetical protein